MLLLEGSERKKLWEELIRRIEEYIKTVPDLRVAPASLDREEIRALLREFDFEHALPPLDVLNFAAEKLESYQVHSPHPRYFGLFNPSPAVMGIAADALVAAYNPQLAAWSQSPFASEVENHLVRSIGRLFGYEDGCIDGVFATGGAEANHTALLAALRSQFPEFTENGVQSIQGKPVFYLSADAHDSLIKAAGLCGLGMGAARRIRVTPEMKMDMQALAEEIEKDRETGCRPFLVAATAGSTGAGAVDPLEPIAEICRRYGLWLHVDAAYGGAVIVCQELKDVLRGIDRADSITFDLHKWFSVPLGAGMLLTRHPKILLDTFRVAASYMPREAAEMEVVDPFAHSMQWSRRFIGLKAFCSMAVHGWDGYRSMIRHMTDMGNLVRRLLQSDGWEEVNRTPLPVICFVDPQNRDAAEYHREIVRRVVESGKAWISTVVLGTGVTAIRACVTNFRTQPEDIRILVAALQDSRKDVLTGSRNSGHLL